MKNGGEARPGLISFLSLFGLIYAINIRNIMKYNPTFSASGLKNTDGKMTDKERFKFKCKCV